MEEETGTVCTIGAIADLEDHIGFVSIKILQVIDSALQSTRYMLAHNQVICQLGPLFGLKIPWNHDDGTRVNPAASSHCDIEFAGCPSASCGSEWSVSQLKMRSCSDIRSRVPHWLCNHMVPRCCSTTICTCMWIYGGAPSFWYLLQPNVLHHRQVY